MIFNWLWRKEKDLRNTRTDEKESELEQLPSYFYGVTSAYFSGVKNKPIAELFKTQEVKNLKSKNNCEFSKRYFSRPSTKVKAVTEIEDLFGLNLNSPEVIQKVLGVMLLSKTKNIIDDKDDDVIDYFPPLFSCNDHALTKRLSNFIKIGSNDDEYTKNYVYRIEFRKKPGKRDLFNSNDPKHPRVSVPSN